jgi:hypothetical protein
MVCVGFPTFLYYIFSGVVIVFSVLDPETRPVDPDPDPWRQKLPTKIPGICHELKSLILSGELEASPGFGSPSWSKKYITIFIEIWNF